MATIKRTENGQVVRHDYGYFYLADDSGNPASGGYWDQAEAEAQLDTPGDVGGWDVDVDDRGNPAEDGDGRFAKVQWDIECDDEEFYDALASRFRAGNETWGAQLWSFVTDSHADLAWVPVAEARRFAALCETLPGWDNGPEYAPNPIIFDFPAED